MLMFYAGVGCLVGIALGVAGMPSHRAFYLGMAWPAFFYALARRATKAKFLADVEVWAGITPIRQEIQVELAVSYSHNADTFVKKVKQAVNDPRLSDDIPG